MQHDYESGGSASQTTDGFVSALFGAPPPATYAPSWAEDPWEMRTQTTDSRSVIPFDPWGADTGTPYMYTQGPGEVDLTGDESQGGEEDLGDMSPHSQQIPRRVQPDRELKGKAAARFSPSGKKHKR